ncbi:MAG: NAD(P)/FAD-dependent oxidoreductase [Solirubrobacteraceae bacterium]
MGSQAVVRLPVTRAKPGRPFDVAIVGASIAGCSAARLFAQAGARVALIERRPDIAAYKVACTHAILSSATPTIAALGLERPLEDVGAVRTHADFWTPCGGWIRAPADAPRGYGVTRRALDPILRQLSVDTPGVELFAGQTAVGLLSDDGRPAGVEVAGAHTNGRTHSIRARLVVGADGRESTTARLARVPGRVRPHGRFFYFAYWRGVQPRTNRIRAWLLDPDGVSQFPSEDGLTLLAVAVHHPRLPEFRSDLEGAYARRISSVPDAPDLSEAQRVSKLIGKLAMPNVMRPAAAGGIAFVGDAALATDPLFGSGCSWAFQSAEWLVDETAPALLGGGNLTAALGRYRRLFRRRLALHHFLIAEFSSGRRLLPAERALFRAASVDASVAAALEQVVSRRRSPLRLLDPRLAPSVVLAAARSGR